MSIYFYAGAPRDASTGRVANTTGECEHHHQTPEAAQRCIDEMDRALKRANGPSAYCDRSVMVNRDGVREPWAAWTR